MACSNCGSDNVKSAGALMRGVVMMARSKCNECDHVDVFPVEREFSIEPSIPQETKAKVIVVTSAVLGQPVEPAFLATLQNYCKSRDAELFIIPIKYKIPLDEIVETPEIIQYFLHNNIEFGANYRIMGAIKLVATMEHPLSSLDAMSKGTSLVFGHPQVSLRTVHTTLPLPAILSTTGCVTKKNYTISKQGFKAEFNHSYSALVLEMDSDGDVFQRHLNFDGDGFQDLETYYTFDNEHIMNGVLGQNFIKALVTGDEHIMFQDKIVAEVTYTNFDSIVNVLRPKNIIRHDVLDAYTVSHHHKFNVFTQFAKWKYNKNSIHTELDETLDFIIKTTPDYAKSIIVSSNHNDHLLKWLNACEPKIEPWNAEIYHKLMYLMLAETRMTGNGASYPDPFELYARTYKTDSMVFLKRNEQFLIDDVSLNFHGDVGLNGSRGSRKSFSGLPTKTIIGHSHSPGITHGVYQVGTSSKLQLEYNVGPSSWAHCHCLIYGNGKRTLIFIINGKWRA